MRKPWPYKCNVKVHRLVAAMIEELGPKMPREKRINVYERFLQKAYDLGTKNEAAEAKEHRAD